MKPSPLKKGDTLGIAAPAGPFKKSLFLKGVKQLQKAGFQVSYSKNIFSQKNYLAGSDERRSQELNSLLRSPAKAILFARGGYGCQRIVENLPPQMSPKLLQKILIGSSDLTVLLNVVWQKYKIPSLYGPMVAPHFRDEHNAKILKKVLTDPDYFFKQKLQATHVLHLGNGNRKAKGIIVGGCLSLVIASLKTHWEIDTDNKILLLEDTQEAPYKVDRMLTQLLQSGKLTRVKGIALGTFQLKETLFPKNIREVFEERLKNFRGPILWGIPFGHCPRPLYVPIGLPGEITGHVLKISKSLFHP